MFEELVCKILIRYLGKYVEGLNKEHLKISLFSGEVKLANLKLKTSAFNSLKLPILIKSGFIGQLTLIVPWSNLKNESVIVKISDIFAITGPNVDSSAEETEEEMNKRLLAEKQDKLAQAEQNLEAKLSLAEGVKGSSIMSRLVEKIVDNLQIEISKVHIRYEDTQTDPKSPFCAGITIQEISAVSTDGNWNKKFIQEPHQIIFKLFKLKQLSIYWNNMNSKGTFDPNLKYTTLQEMYNAMESLIWQDKTTPPKDNLYILQPVSATLQLKMNKGKQSDIPKYDANILFDNLSISLDDTQYQNLIKLLMWFGKDRRSKKVLAKLQREKSVKEIDEKLRLLYINLYKKFKRGEITHPEKKQMDSIEFELLFDALWNFRIDAKAQMRKEDKEAAEKQQQIQQGKSTYGWMYNSTVSYVSSWIWTPPSDESGGEKEVEIIDAPEEKEVDWEQLRSDFLKTIEYEEGDDLLQTPMPKNYVHMIFQFSMRRGSITISSKYQNLLQTNLVGFNISFQSRPGINSKSFKISLEDLKVKDQATPNTAWGLILAPSVQINSSGNKKNLFNLLVETNPLNEDVAYSLSLDMEPLDIVIHLPLVDRISALIMNPIKEAKSSTIVQNLERKAKKQVKELQYMTRKTVGQELKKHKKFKLSINIDAPNIIIPEDITREDSLLLVADFGFLSFRTQDELNTKEPNYDYFSLNLQSLQLMFIDEKERYIPLVQKFDINIMLQLHSEENLEPIKKKEALARIKMFGDLPQLHIKLDEFKIIKLIKILSNIRRTENNIDTLAPLPFNELVDEEESVGMSSIEEVRLIRNEINFSIASLNITICNEEKNLVLLGIEFKNLMLGVRVQEYEIKAALGLSSFLVMDPSIPEQPYVVSSSVGDTDLIQIEYQASGDMKSHFDRHFLNISFNILNIIIHRRLVMFIDWVNMIVPHLPGEETSKSEIKEKSNPTPSFDKVKISVRIKQVGLDLYDEDMKRTLADFKVTDSYLQFVRGTSTKLKGTLGTISITDKHPDTLYPTIFGIQGEQLVDVLFTNRNNNPSLLISMNSIRVVVVRSFIERVGYYFMQFQKMERLVKESTDTITTAVKTRTEVSHLFKWEVIIKNPQIVLPSDFQDSDTIMLDLGEIAFFSKVENTKTDYFLSVSNTSISATEGKEPTKHIIRNIDISLSLSYLFESSLYMLKGNISSIKIDLTDTQLKLFQTVINNLTSISTPTKTKRDIDPSPILPIEQQQPNFDYVTELPFEKRPLFQADLSLASIFVELYRTKQQPNRDSEMKNVYESILKCTVNDLCSTCFVQTDGSMDLKFTLHSIVLLYSKPDPKIDKAFQTILESREGTDYCELKLEWIETKESSKLKIELDRPRAIIVPEIIYDLIDYFENVGVEEPKDSSNTTLVENKEKKDFPLDIRIWINDPEVCLPRDTRDASSNTLIAKLSLLVDLKVTSTQFKIIALAKNFEAYSCELLREADTISPLILPWSFKISHQEIFNGKNSDKQTTLKFLPGHFILSFQDFLLFSDIAESFSKSFSSDKKIVESSLSQTNHIIQFETIGLKLMILDDSVGKTIPLLRFNLENLKSTIIINSTLEVDLAVGLEVSYYNPVMAHWDCLMPSWPIRVLFKNPQAEKNFISLQAEQLLDLNITKTFIDIVFLTQNVWQEEYKLHSELKNQKYRPLLDTDVPMDLVRSRSITKANLKSRPAFDPYIISNNTGAKIRYWTSLNPKPLTLKPGSSVPLIPSQNANLRLQENPDQGTLSVEIPGYCDLISHLTIDKVGVYVIKPQFKNQLFKIVYSVSFESGSLLLNLHGGVLIESGCDHDVSITLSSPRSKSSFSLQPHKIHYVALNWLLSVDTATLSFNPPTSSSLDSSQTTILSPRNPIPPPSPSSSSSQPDVIPFTTLLNAQSSGVQFYSVPYYTISVHHSPHHTTLKVLPPVILENLLPYPVEWEVTSGGSGDLMVQRCLEKGERTAIHANISNEKVWMRLKLKGFDWSGYFGIREGEESIIVKVEDKLKRVLRLNLKVDSTESKTISVFCKYWIQNKTGLRCLYKSPTSDNQGSEEEITTSKSEIAAGQDDFLVDYFYDMEQETRDLYHHPKAITEKLSEPFLFSPTPSTLLTTQLSLRIANSPWSNPIPIDSVGWVSYLTIPDQPNQHTSENTNFELAIHITVPPKPFDCSKLITVSPRYILINNTNRQIIYRQTHPPRRSHTLAMKSRVPFHPTTHFQDPSQSSSPVLSFTLTNCKWSGSINPSKIGKYSINVRDKNLSIVFLAQVEIKNQNGSNFIIINAEDPEFPPYRIDNCSPVKLTVYQKYCTDRAQIISPYSTSSYAWDEPGAEHKIVLDFSRGSNYISNSWEINLDKVKVIRKVFKTPEGILLRGEIVVDGPTRVFRVVSVDHHTGDEDRKASLKESEEDSKLEVNISLAGVGVSLVDSTPKELVYLTLDNITFKYEETISKQNLELSIGSGQLDNQLPKYPSQSPIVLSATPSFKKEFFSIKLEKSKYFDNIVFFSNLEVLSQGLEIDLKLDEIFIEEMENYISNFTHHITNVVKHFSGDPSNNKQVELLPTPTGELQSKKFYFKRFLLGEIQLNLTNRISDEMKSKILLKSFSSYNQVPLSLATISFEDNFSTMNDLGAMIADKYLSQLVPQIYKLVGYNDLLGSPLTLFSSIGLGVHDLIVEPAHILLTNPRAFPHSFKSGTKSMLTRFVYSVSDSASKISGTFGKLISSASKQKNFLVEANPVEPRHVGEALTTGSFEFMASVGGGVHHLVMDPLDGLRGEGLFGLVKGIGKGSLAAVSFPILGFLNMVTTVSVGVRNTTTLFGGKFKQQRFRVRPPRCYMSDLYLPRYSLRHALGQYYLQALDLTEPGLHEYRWHTEQGSLIYILSNYSLISIEKATLLVQWVIQYTDINPVKLQQVDNEVHVFRQSAPKPLVVTLKDASEAKSFFDQLNAIINRVFNS